MHGTFARLGGTQDSVREITVSSTYKFVPESELPSITCASKSLRNTYLRLYSGFAVDFEDVHISIASVLILEQE
jgi:hypothetical protein